MVIFLWLFSTNQLIFISKILFLPEGHPCTYPRPLNSSFIFLHIYSIIIIDLSCFVSVISNHNQDFKMVLSALLSHLIDIQYTI